MIKFYFSPAPNPTKVALFLEEAGLPYEVVPVDTRKGDKFKPEFLALNPNAKVPVIVDGDEYAAAIEALVRQHQRTASRRSRGSAEEQVHLQTELDEEARRHLFRHVKSP